MKTYVQPWICKVKGEAETVLQLQSTEKVLQVSETEITDSNQILSKERKRILYSSIFGRIGRKRMEWRVNESQLYLNAHMLRVKVQTGSVEELSQTAIGG